MKGIPIRRRSVDGRSYGDPHTDPAVGIRTGVGPLGKGGGGRRMGLSSLESSEQAQTRSGRSGLLDNQSGREERTGLWGGRKPVHWYHKRGCGAGHPLGIGKMKARERVRDMTALGGSFTTVLETPAVGPRADVRPLGEVGGGR